MVDGRWPERAVPAVERPRALLGEVAREITFTFRHRRGWLLGIGVNVALAVTYGLLAHPTRRYGHSVAPFVAAGLLTWVLADPMSTNQLGNDADRVVEGVRQGVDLRRLLVVRNLTVAALLSGLALVVTATAASVLGSWRSVGPALLLSVAVVATWMAVGNVASVLFPYRPIRLRVRFAKRVQLWWWGWCVLVPYVIFGGISVLAVPAIVVTRLTVGVARTHRAAWAVAFVACAAVYWVVGTGLAARIARSRWPRIEARLARSGPASLDP